MQSVLKQPFTNVQLELLKTFSHQLSEKDLIDLKQTLALFFSERLINQADKIWDDKKWDDKTVDDMLTKKMRKSK
ncbi:hypothetical protein [Flavobacterium foetidum]|uniref:hypothetical protein n=1 Tax=Flavobacterium foetidum TaxID=2026681 RepID=UPI00107577C2|nr:hypothetical protein [Flavobacterium foetidum]KAF2511324.1 hypothetical protein E0W73_17415 [Flavobacterium foetidum]